MMRMMTRSMMIGDGNNEGDNGCDNNCDIDDDDNANDDDEDDADLVLTLFNEGAYLTC